MTKIKLTDNLSLSQIIRGFWRLDTWELSTDELIDNMKSSITNKKLMENHLGIIIQLMIESYDPVKKVFRDYIQIILTYI